MPLGITPLKDILTLLKRLRWFLTLVIFFVAAGLAWYGWQSGRGLVWIVFGSVLLLLLVVVVWGSKITFWLARRLEHQILRNQSLASRRLVNTGLQQGEKLVQLGSKELEKNINGAKQVLSQALNSLGQDFRAKPGKVTWVSAPPAPHNPDAVCPACGQGVRIGAKFCDHCGKPIMHS
jgi:type VI protein secretion system component VasK